MPPKVAAKAKGKARPKAKAGEAIAERLPVPPPPPTPVLVRFPEIFSEQSPASRCVLLSWLDAAGAYKLQSRPFTCTEDRDAQAGWEDSQQVIAQPTASRGHVWLVTGLDSIRVEFRLALKEKELLGSDGPYIANWFSPASEPVVSVVDPPARPHCEVVAVSDYQGIGVRLKFGPANEGEHSAPIKDSEADEPFPWAAWPGLGICKVQARWRALRPMEPGQGLREPGADASDAGRFSEQAAKGEMIIGPLVEVSKHGCEFDSESRTWTFTMGHIPHGIVTRFEVRLGTEYRWSAWSEESDDLEVALPPPQPTAELGEEGTLQVASSSHCTITLNWPPFRLARGLTLCEYRVLICQLGAPEPGQVDPDPWDDLGTTIAGIFTVTQQSIDDEARCQPIEYVVRGLQPDTCYAIRVDARYPFLGERGWSVPAVTRSIVQTGFPDRPPPAAPMPLPLADVEEILRAAAPQPPPTNPRGSTATRQPSVGPTSAGTSRVASPLPASSVVADDEDAAEVASASAIEPLPVEEEPPEVIPFSEDQLWLTLLIEGPCMQDYHIEFRPDEAALLNAMPSKASLGGWYPVAKATPLNLPQYGEAWNAVAVLFTEDSSAWPWETVVCRLRHRRPITTSPLLGVGCSSPPVLTKVDQPLHPCTAMRFCTETQSFGLMVRFHLGKALPPYALTKAGSRPKEPSSALGAANSVRVAASSSVESSRLAKSVPAMTKVHRFGHRYVTHVQVRLTECPFTEVTTEEGTEDPSVIESSTSLSQPQSPRGSQPGEQLLLQQQLQQHLQQRQQNGLQRPPKQVLLRPRPLPGALSYPHQQNSVPLPGLPPVDGPTGMPLSAPLVFDCGERHEVWLDVDDGVQVGMAYKVELRVGTLERWSSWTLATPLPVRTELKARPVALQKEAVLVELPDPRVPKARWAKEKDLMRLACIASAPKFVKLRFPPFIVAPAVKEVEYVITALPRYRQGAAGNRSSIDANASPKQIARRGGGAGEASGAVTKIFTTRQHPVRTDAELARVLLTKGTLQDAQDMGTFALQWTAAEEAEIDDFFSKACMAPIEMTLEGLLPATEYEVTVTGRYLGETRARRWIVTGDQVPDASILNAVIETVCGENPPAAPVPIPIDLVESTGLMTSQRTFLLEIEDKDGYVVEMSPAEDHKDSWYPVSGTTPKKGPGSRWWACKTGEAPCEWVELPTKRVEAVGVRSGLMWVRAQAPEFVGPAALRCEVADAVQFRLRATNRGRMDCHPVRWVGSTSCTLAAGIAPVALPPLPKRCFSDGSWCVAISFFAFISTPPTAQLVSEARAQWGKAAEVFPHLIDDDEVESIEQEGSEEPGEDGGDEMPIGFGHRLISRVHARVRLVGRVWPIGEEPDEAPLGHVASTSSTAKPPHPLIGNGASGGAAWVSLPEVFLEHCVDAARHYPTSSASARSVETKEAGDRCVVLIPGSSSTLEEGGIYEAQVRVGDGYRWSPWSMSSSCFCFLVPQPRPEVDNNSPVPPLYVETLSASVVRLRWPAFEAPPGITEVEYRLAADPVALGSTVQGVRSVTATCVLPAEPKGTAMQAELSHLLPATLYHFRVSARFPRIGWRSWGVAAIAKPATTLEDQVADWPAPPAPAPVPHAGPAPFLLSEEGIPLFAGNERAFLLGFADTATEPVGRSYRLEYRHVGLPVGQGAFSVDYRSQWLSPIEVSCVETLSSQQVSVLAPRLGSWTLPPRLWRVRLPSVADITRKPPTDGLVEAHHLKCMQAQMQRVQFRLAAKQREECPPTRWFSLSTPPLCAALAPPLDVAIAMTAADDQLGIRVQFTLDMRLSPTAFNLEHDQLLTTALRHAEEASAEAQVTQQDEAEGDLQTVIPPELPRGFGHAFVTHFQCRARRSPRPPSQPPTSGGKPLGVPWSRWTDCVDSVLPVALADGKAPSRPCYAMQLTLPGGEALEFGTWFQVSVRVSDGICWSEWSTPSEPVKVYVAPPKAEQPDTATVKVDTASGGSNVMLSWSPLRAHGGLRLIEYGIFIREVLRDHHEICERRLAAIVGGEASPFPEPALREEVMTCELRDLRQDVNYIFTVAARYPKVGSRDFEDAVSSTPLCLQPAAAPLPVPMQLPMPSDRLRKLQLQRGVLLRWSHCSSSSTTGGDSEAASSEGASTHRDDEFELQALPDGAPQDGWTSCRNVQIVTVDATVAQLVQEIPRNALRCRFRLWHKASGRFGRASPLMLSLVEQPTHVGVSRCVNASAVEILLRVPLSSPHGSHNFVCRYQVRFRPEVVEGDWTELPPQLLWHQQNDHIVGMDNAVDAKGAVLSGLEQRRAAEGVVAIRSELCEWTGNVEEDDAKDGPATMPELPTIPLAEVSSIGHVNKQRCLVAQIREEDGLDPDRFYEFSIRVGDLYRLSDWSAPTKPAKLGLPPAAVPQELTAECATLSIATVTDSCIHVLWPQFVPSKEAGVPIDAVVEYLLTVLPVAGKRRLSIKNRSGDDGSTGAHSQWFLSSAFPKGTEETVGEPLGVVVSGLHPYTAYELKLAVRYARLGSRKWHDALSYVCTTKKADADLSAMATARDTATPAVGAPMALPSGVHAGKVQDSPRHRDSRASPVPNSPRASYQVPSSPRASQVPGSPRRLPPLNLEVAPSVRSTIVGNSYSLGERRVSTSRGFAAAMEALSADALQASDLDAPPVEEWQAAAEGDLQRIVGSVAAVSPSLRGIATPSAPKPPPGAAPSGVGYPPRSLGNTHSSRRDPKDTRPVMPPMPSLEGKARG